MSAIAPLWGKSGLCADRQKSELVTRCGLPLAWLQAPCFDHARRVWCQEVLNQCLGSIRFFCTCSKADKENKIARALELRG